MRIETYIRKSFKMKAHFVTRVEETPSELIAYVDRIGNRHLQCSQCGMEVRHTYGRREERHWRDLPMREQRLVLVYRPFRVLCSFCGVRGEKLPWAEKGSRVTYALEKAVSLMTRKLSWSEVASLYGLNWKTVATIVRRKVARGLAQRKLKPLRIIGVDEVSRKKGHLYLTLVYDLERSHLLWVGVDRKEETLDEFFAWLGKRKSRHIQVVCLDMWKPYLASVKRHTPQATLVFDRFHLVQHLNRALDEVRRGEVRRLSGEDQVAMKKTRFILLKNPWNLTPKQKRRLSTLVKLNLPVIRGYYMKEEFQRFWDYVSPGWAFRHMKQWLWWATHSRLEPFKEFAKLVKKHMEGIMAWTKERITNGALEGMNNKIKLVSHRSFGFRNTQNYIAAIYHSCADLSLT